VATTTTVLLEAEVFKRVVPVVPVGVPPAALVWPFWVVVDAWFVVVVPLEVLAVFAVVELEDASEAELLDESALEDGDSAGAEGVALPQISPRIADAGVLS
jgi:hypothetical protein